MNKNKTIMIIVILKIDKRKSMVANSNERKTLPFTYI